VHLVQHPLVHDALATLRDASTNPETFRHMAVRISLLLAAEATRDIPSHSVRVQTPIGPADGRRVTDGVVVVPVLRAGLGMLDAVLELIPTARVGHIGLQRDEATAIASKYYSKLPSDLRDSYVLMIDPMLATGGSAVSALDLIRKAGGRDVRMICIVAAPEASRSSKNTTPTSTSTRRSSTRASTRTSTSCPASATSAIGCTGPDHHETSTDRTGRRHERGTPCRAGIRPCHRRRVAHRPDVHRAQQDPLARIPAR